MKTSKWFSANQEPDLYGFYETDRPEAIPRRAMLEWTKDGWKHTKDSAAEFTGLYADMSASEGDKWRGLVQKPA